MEAMRDVGVQRVVLASSGAVYGHQSVQPLTEDLFPSPRSPYAVSKLAAEHYVHTIGRLWGIETVALRIFNAYGPGQPLPAAHPPVIPHFLRQAARNGTLVIHGKGDQTRDFVYIDDVVEAMVAASTAPTIDQSVVNIGSGTGTGIKMLAQYALEAVGANTEWIFTEDQDPGPSQMAADIQRAHKKLGYQPRLSIREGLEAMVSKDPRFQLAAE
jgi:UDP-glucose 4-epimerase